jgi:penicillin-binding protein 2
MGSLRRSRWSAAAPATSPAGPTSGDGSGSSRGTATARQKSRLRLVVVQAIVLSLFVTLFARLWYLQVLGGEAYQAQAAEQSVREVVVQPARGLIVDDMGRPLVANRTSWVVTVDRTMLGKMDDEDQEVLLRRVARTVGSSYKEVRARTLLCGEPGSVQGRCWNGSPYQPVPVAEDVPQETAVAILEQSEDYPAVLAESASVRAYPSPYGINAAHLLGYLSPITEEELDEAEAEGDTSVHGASVVGRAGVERQYDRFLRGEPGYKRVAVDSMGRVLGDSGLVRGRAGDTLVTSIDARVQAVVERQLRSTIMLARRTTDTVTGRRYAADSGAVVVMDVTNGRIVAMAGYPTYDPGVWVGGIGRKSLARLYSERAGTPLLFRATQGQFAPGSTWKPFMTAGALSNGYSQDTRLDCSSSFRVGNRDFRNYESGAYGSIGFDKALEVSCNTFFYRIGYGFWQRFGSDVDDVHAKDPLVKIAKVFGFGSETGIDLPGEAGGRIADRQWKRDYYEANKDYYCKVGKRPGYDFLHRFAREFCVEGYAYRAGDAVNFAIGQGDTIVTPLQLARAYGVLANGGTLWEPRVGKAIVDPQGEVVRRIEPRKAGSVKVAKRHLRYIDRALQGVSARGTMSWRLVDFPLDKVRIRSKTGSAEVYGKQSTSWVASYDKRYAVVMMVSQGGTGSGTSGPAIRKIWETLYGVRGTDVDTRKAALPGARPPAGLPVFAQDGEILPPAVRDQRSGRPGRRDRGQRR